MFTRIILEYKPETGQLNSNFLDNEGKADHEENTFGWRTIAKTTHEGAQTFIDYMWEINGLLWHHEHRYMTMEEMMEHWNEYTANMDVLLLALGHEPIANN